MVWAVRKSIPIRLIYTVDTGPPVLFPLHTTNRYTIPSVQKWAMRVRFCLALAVEGRVFGWKSLDCL
jgi:hypothetical protein